MARSGSIKTVWVLDRAYRRTEGDTVIMAMFPAKQLNHGDPPSGPAVSSVAPSGVVRSVVSDRHHDQHVPENPYGHRIICLRESIFFYMLLIKASVLY